MDRITAARKRYRPDPVRLVFVAEAPPPPDSDRFFYFADVRNGDSLFLNLMRALYLDVRTVADVKLIRKRKAELLERFKADGYFLVDASDKPIPKGSSKEPILRAALPALRETIAALSDGRRLPFVLISETVHAVCRNALVNDHVNVLNSEPIPFPRQQWLKPFHERMGRLLTGKLAPRRSGVFD